MTTGQKIAAKRRELELSQEALGAELGVSRQTIYKWESDTSLPEIDKLVALSRRFQVPVGWLLGVEEEPERQSADFSPEQLKLLEEILNRYQRAEPEELTPGQREQVAELVRQGGAPKPKSKRRRWARIAAAAAILVVLGVGWNLFERLDQMDQRYYDLANSVNNVTHSVNSQIGSITDRVEEVLKSQNELTADYSTQLLSTDLAVNTATFSLRVVPKTYTPGMSVIFLADNGGETREFPAQEGENGTFTGEAACTLTDSITLSAVFFSLDTRQTQLLDQYSWLYSDSFPEVVVGNLTTELMGNLEEDGSYQVEPCTGMVQENTGSTTSAVWEQLGQSQVQEAQLGLFRNQKLIQWLEPCEKPEGWDTEEGARYFHTDGLNIPLEDGDYLCFAALVTDQYGRSFMVVSHPDLHVVDGEWSTGGSYSTNPADWDFTP